MYRSTGVMLASLLLLAMMASALKKLHMTSQRIPMDANPATAHMFIVNPLRGGGFAKLFSTHPPMEERVARLEQMAYSPVR